MSLGLFSLLERNPASARVPSRPQCGACGLWQGCQSPKMPVAGEGRKGIMVAAESPGKTEDEEGIPLVGKAGQLLQKYLSQVGINLFRDCWVVNSARCRPPRNALPPKAIGYCRPFTVNDIRELKPRAILLLGGAAIKSIIGWQWREEVGDVGRWVGWQIPCQELNAYLCPTWHPSYLARQEGARDYPVLEGWFLRHLRAFARLTDRPWPNGPPDYASQVQVTIDPDEAAQVVEKFTQNNKLTAFDFETDRIKPDHPDAFIHSCALSDGEDTVAFPWVGEATRAMKKFLCSGVPKIGWSIKFESRWARKIAGVRIRNWRWDGMLAAHVLDNRRGITGLEFQAWVQLGQRPWDESVLPFLKSAGGGNAPNRIKQADLRKVLMYCGCDARLEFELARIQAKQLGIKL